MTTMDVTITEHTTPTGRVVFVVEQWRNPWGGATPAGRPAWEKRIRRTRASAERIARLWRARLTVALATITPPACRH